MTRKQSNRCGCLAWSQPHPSGSPTGGSRCPAGDGRSYGWWDTHVKGFESLRDGFLPRFDRAYSALIEDLDQRGLLSSTLVLAWGEFGRTPRVNGDGGRDHYPNVFSAALAGGPVKGGRVVGESDEKGAFPRSNAKTPQDVLALLYQHLGVDTTQHYRDGTGRPIAVGPAKRPADRRAVLIAFLGTGSNTTLNVANSTAESTERDVCHARNATTLFQILG